MAKVKSFISLIVVIGFCTIATTSLAKSAPKTKCGFNGDYSFYFWDPDFPVAGVGFFSVQLNSGSKCRSGVVLPGGIINCDVEGIEFEDFIEDGFVFIETDGQGTMEIETASSEGICGTGVNAIEFDVSIVLGGKTVLFNTNSVRNVQSGTTPNAGYFATLTGRADKCFSGGISGCYDLRFWDTDLAIVGDCSICVGVGLVTSGNCQCNTNGLIGSAGFETHSVIASGGYSLGDGCESSTGLLAFTVISDPLCGVLDDVFLDFAVALGGNEIVGACDTFSDPLVCSFEGQKQ